jgi:hypothetical protein
MRPDNVIAALEPFVTTHAVCTVVSDDAEFVVDIQRNDDGHLAFGYEDSLAVQALFEAKLTTAISAGCVLILRNFTALRDVKSNLPTKELRVWSIANGDLYRLAAEDVRLAFATDGGGAPLDGERAVVFPDAEH